MLAVDIMEIVLIFITVKVTYLSPFVVFPSGLLAILLKNQQINFWE